MLGDEGRREDEGVEAFAGRTKSEEGFEGEKEEDVFDEFWRQFSPYLRL